MLFTALCDTGELLVEPKNCAHFAKTFVYFDLLLYDFYADPNRMSTNYGTSPSQQKSPLLALAIPETRRYFTGRTSPLIIPLPLGSVMDAVPRKLGRPRNP